jgi:hypothetical protein
MMYKQKLRELLYRTIYDRKQIGKIDLGEIMKSDLKELERKNAPYWDRRVVELETYGGLCPQCDEPWIPVFHKNDFVKMTIYQPSCNCYPRCPFCGRLTLVEIETQRSDERVCNNCGAKYLCSEKAVKYNDKGKSHEGRCDGLIVPMIGGYFQCSECGKNYNGEFLMTRKRWNEFYEAYEDAGGNDQDNPESVGSVGTQDNA